MYNENVTPVFPHTRIPYRYRRIVMPRFRVLPTDGGAIAALMKIWSHMPYTAGEMRTGYYGAFDDYYYHGNKFKKIYTKPFEWRGCPEAAVKTLDVFWGRDRYAIDNKGFRDNLLNNNIIRFLQDNGALRIDKIPNSGNYCITSRALKKANPINNPQKYFMSKGIENFNPCTENGFFFIPRNFVSGMLPCDVNNNSKRSYYSHGLEFTYADAFYDLYSNTCFMDNEIVGSQLGAIVAINGSPIISHAYLAERWGWCKSRVGRFFAEMKGLLTPISLGSSRGSVIYVNTFISDQTFWREHDIIPTPEQVKAVFLDIRPVVKENDMEKKSPKNLFPNISISIIAKKILEKVGVAKELIEDAASSLGYALRYCSSIHFRTRPKYSKKAREHMLSGAYWDPNDRLINLAQQIYCKRIY